MTLTADLVQIGDTLPDDDGRRVVSVAYVDNEVIITAARRCDDVLDVVRRRHSRDALLTVVPA